MVTDHFPLLPKGLVLFFVGFSFKSTGSKGSHAVSGQTCCCRESFSRWHSPLSAVTAQACFNTTCVSCHYRWRRVNTDRQVAGSDCQRRRSVHFHKMAPSTCLSGKTKSITKNIISCGKCGVCNYLIVLDLHCAAVTAWKQSRKMAKVNEF